jgi:hypothetical protein
MNLPIGCMYFWFLKLLVTIFGLGERQGQRLNKEEKWKTTPHSPPESKNQGPSWVHAEPS